MLFDVEEVSDKEISDNWVLLDWSFKGEHVLESWHHWHVELEVEVASGSRVVAALSTVDNSNVALVDGASVDDWSVVDLSAGLLRRAR